MTHLYSHHGAASLLAIRDGQLRRMVRANQVPFVRLPNGEIRFNPVTLARWVVEHERMPAEDGPKE